MPAWRTELVTENMGLCGFMANRFAGKGLEYELCFSECQMALMRAARAFSKSRGFQFSTYACKCMHFACVRLFKTREVRLNPEWRGKGDWMPSCQADVFMGVDPAKVGPTVDMLPGNERAVIRWRFGLNGGHRETLEEVGRRLGVSKERVRQIQVVALGKLKALLTEVD